ncbi:hypothetical protein ACQ4PT_026634 [Festuca glaucescens]
MTAPLLAALSPSHCPSLLTSTISASRHGAVTPRRGRRACSWSTARGRGGTVSRISCSSTLDDTPAGLITVAKPNYVKMKATVKVEHTDPSNRKVLHLELVSSDLDSQTGREKTPIPGDAYYWGTDPVCGHEFLLEATFDVPVSFGPIGAVLVENEHDKKMFLISIVVAPGNNESASVTFEGNSWIKPRSADTVKHVFFSLKSYLPSETPPGVESLRESELKAICGDGSGERNELDRIYDYDVYNDLGKPDIDDNLTRPVLGGDAHPYPRRCRTGRPRSDKDPSSEKAGNYVYVPKDEVFSPSDDLEFLLNKGLMSSTPGLWTMLDTSERKSLSFPSFTAIDSLFDDTVVEQPPSTPSAMLVEMARKLLNAWRPASDRMEEALQALKGLKFEMPKLIASTNQLQSQYIVGHLNLMQSIRR